MSSEHYTPAVNPLPPVVVALVLFIIGIELAFTLGSRGLIGGPEAVGWRLDAIQNYAFSADIFDWMVLNGRWPFEHVIRFVTYPFVSANFTQAVFVCVFVLAMGKMVGEVFGGFPMLLIFVVSGIGGALAYAVLLDPRYPLIGGFPPVYGLIGAFTWLLWRKLSLVGANQARAFQLIAVLMGIQFLFGLIFGGNWEWVADLGGFATGFGVSFLVAPGAWDRIVGRIRRD
ncbi:MULTISPECIES: rhomboid family intramembrane serine protease [unclassified Ruegeria]|uniref:rhomboid family intramembrane serine protease n=1 Tax=unclassified Ruegeria TaxID=2625375 RepID=UPI0014931A10|nr:MULTISPECIES: rhomboid family intramembrane serine protease [unclassified Ruegeria]NOD47914.1 rhomboid family intramembrane serine protease [Ruegeria sp. HKCCD5849]NOD52898.1 rhomboid family intramembrane serine protease [Ruegeria sp. HKCCD5851]NOD69044.1 rhomboid family intramembrane serine protease [Ruegeria sp. HKCCD7303]